MNMQSSNRRPAPWGAEVTELAAERPSDAIVRLRELMDENRRLKQAIAARESAIIGRHSMRPTPPNGAEVGSQVGLQIGIR